MDYFKLIYRELDYDQSGAVSEEELKSILPRVGERLSSRDVEWLFFQCDEDESGELDYEEFVSMLLRLKKERMKIISCCTKFTRWRKRKWDYLCRPRLGKKRIKNLGNTAGKKMGRWSKHNHPVVGRPYFYNNVSSSLMYILVRTYSQCKTKHVKWWYGWMVSVWMGEVEDVSLVEYYCHPHTHTHPHIRPHTNTVKASRTGGGSHETPACQCVVCVCVDVGMSGYENHVHNHTHTHTHACAHARTHGTLMVCL